MRCSCGQSGTIILPRRELPYCDLCFHQLLARLVRQEMSTHNAREIRVRPPRSATEALFTAAIEQLATLARRPLVQTDEGAIAGCMETQAVANARALFGGPRETHFPRTITWLEMRTFYKPAEAAEMDALLAELQELDRLYPGTIASLANR